VGRGRGRKVGRGAVRATDADRTHVISRGRAAWALVNAGLGLWGSGVGGWGQCLEGARTPFVVLLLNGPWKRFEEENELDARTRSISSARSLSAWHSCLIGESWNDYGIQRQGATRLSDSGSGHQKVIKNSQTQTPLSISLPLPPSPTPLPGEQQERGESGAKRGPRHVSWERG